MNFSSGNFKKNLEGLLCAFFGLFHLVLFSFLPYISPYISGISSEYLGAYASSFSGYSCLSFPKMCELTCGFFIPIFQIFAIIGATALLAVGVLILLKEFFGIAVPGSIGNFSISSIASLALKIFNIINFAVFFAAILVWICNTESMYGMTAGVRPAVGLIIYFILNLAVFVGLIVIKKVCPQFFDAPAGAGSAATHICERCGASCKTSASFCSKCGGKVVEAPPAMAYICVNCGAPMESPNAFCGKCGGTAREVLAKPTYACTNCGARANAKTAFCSACGGKIERK